MRGIEEEESKFHLAHSWWEQQASFFTMEIQNEVVRFFNNQFRPIEEANPEAQMGFTNLYPHKVSEEASEMLDQPILGLMGGQRNCSLTFFEEMGSDLWCHQCNLHLFHS